MEHVIDDQRTDVLVPFWETLITQQSTFNLHNGIDAAFSFAESAAINQVPVSRK